MECEIHCSKTDGVLGNFVIMCDLTLFAISCTVVRGSLGENVLTNKRYFTSLILNEKKLSIPLNESNLNRFVQSISKQFDHKTKYNEIDRSLLQLPQML